MDLASLESAGQTVKTNFLSAGAVIPGMPGSTSNECAFGHAYRTATRGHTNVLVPSDLPEPSVYVSSCTWLLAACGHVAVLNLVAQATRLAACSHHQPHRVCNACMMASGRLAHNPLLSYCSQ